MWSAGLNFDKSSPIGKGAAERTHTNQDARGFVTIRQLVALIRSGSSPGFAGEAVKPREFRESSTRFCICLSTADR